MSVREQVTMMNLATLISANIAANGVTNGESVDGRNDELGLSFFLSIRGTYTDGTYTLSLEESDDNSSWSAVPAEKLVFGGSDNPEAGGVIAGQTSIAVSAATAVGANAAKVGVFSNKRYVRPVVTASGVTTGAQNVNVDVVKHSEYLAA